MTSQRELDRLLVAYFVDGTDELADRVIDAALDQIAHTHQRRPLRAPWRSRPMITPIRLAAAAAIGVLAVGGAFFLFRPGQSSVGPAVPARTASPSPSQAGTPTPARTQTPATTPDIPALTGLMGVGRQIHTAMALADGRVIVVGGYDNKDAALASAALFDPRTNTFEPTGSLADARGEHTATLLSDGRVLITGGGPAGWVFADPFLASAELYDPRTGLFSRTGSMITPREAQTATLLADGRVLVAGGTETQDRSLASAELYDPDSGTFSATGPMAMARAWHTATLLSDGRVLIAGGSPAAWSNVATLNSTEIYDPKTGTFTATGPLTGGRTFHSATLLADGRVLIAGGSLGYQEDLTSAEVYDPNTGTSSLTGPMTEGREYHTASLLSDGRVLITGGGGDYANRTFLASAEIYDPTTGTFSPTGTMADARTNHAATLLDDGRILVTGGFGVQAPLPSAEIYDPTTRTFSPAGGG